MVEVINFAINLNITGAQFIYSNIWTELILVLLEIAGEQVEKHLAHAADNPINRKKHDDHVSNFNEGRKQATDFKDAACCPSAVVQEAA